MKNKFSLLNSKLTFSPSLFNDGEEINFESNLPALHANPGVPIITTSPGQIGTNYDTAAYVNMLAQPDYFERVFGLDGTYNKFAIPIIIERLRTMAMKGASMPYQVKGRDSAYTLYVQGEMQVSTATASATASGPNIIITFQDTSYALFRNTDIVMNNASANVLGRIISPDFTPGSITIAPVNDGIPLNVNDWNVVNQTIIVIGNAQANSSAGRSSLYQVPFPHTFYTQTFRETVKIKRMDDWMTYPKSGGKNWIMAQEGFAVDWLNKQIAMSSIWNTGGIVGAQGNNPTRMFQGLKNSIGDPVIGGVFMQWQAYPSQNDILNYWRELANKRRYEKSMFIHVVGRGYLELIQNLFTTAVILPVGINNTLDRIDPMTAELVKGLDCYTYAFGGINHVFVHEPAMNDAYYNNPCTITGLTQYSQATLSCYTLYQGIFQNAENTAAIPYMGETYFGDKPVIIGISHGMAEDPFFMEKLSPEVGVSISTSEDSNTLQILMDKGYYFISTYMGYNGA